MTTWLTSREFARLAGINDRNARKALTRGQWRDADLHVRQVDGARGGRAGLVMQVALHSLPEDVQAQFRREGQGEQLALPLHDSLKLPPSSSTITAQVDWWLHALREPLGEPVGSPARAKAVSGLVGTELIDWTGKRRTLTRTVIYRQIANIEQDGIAAAARKPRSDAGTPKVVLGRELDALTRFPPELLGQIRDTLRPILRGWMIEGATRHIVLRHLGEQLIKAVVGQGFVPSDMNALRKASRIAVRRLYDQERAPAKKVYNHYYDRKRSDDDKPRIRRIPPALPADCYVLDVHHINVLVRGRNGKVGTVKMLGFFDWATRRLRAEFVFFDERGGVRNLDNIEATRLVFADPSWGVAKQLYIDNGKEYVFTRFIDTLLKLNAADVWFRSDLRASTIITALPYNGAAKPIENIFHQLNARFFKHCQGYIGDDRMNSMEVLPGRLPEPFGTFDEFVIYAQGLISAYNNTVIDSGPLAGKSPNQAFREHVERGWSATVLDPAEFDSVFVERKTRDVRQHAIQLGGRTWTCNELDTYLGDKVVVCEPHFHGFNELRLETLDGAFLGIARPDQAFSYNDPRGAQTSSRRVSQRSAALRSHRKSAASVDVGNELTAWAAEQLPVVPNDPGAIARVHRDGVAGAMVVPAHRPAHTLEEQHAEAEKIRQIRQMMARRAAGTENRR